MGGGWTPYLGGGWTPYLGGGWTPYLGGGWTPYLGGGWWVDSSSAVRHRSGLSDFLMEPRSAKW